MFKSILLVILSLNIFGRTRFLTNKKRPHQMMEPFNMFFSMDKLSHPMNRDKPR